jgi:hypothetical protein
MTRRRLALAAAMSSALFGCSGPGDPASPTTTPGMLTEAGPVEAGHVEAGYAVCPPGLDASFDDMLTRVFSTKSCGTDQKNNCHSTSGASPIGAGNMLDFTLDASAVYAELLGADGGGQVAANVSGPPNFKVLRVVPGDAGASMLYIKLTLKNLSDPHYGAGMPLTAPGSICPEALGAIKTWIDEGAHR